MDRETQSFINTSNKEEITLSESCSRLQDKSEFYGILPLNQRIDETHHHRRLHRLTSLDFCGLDDLSSISSEESYLKLPLAVDLPPLPCSSPGRQSPAWTSVPCQRPPKPKSLNYLFEHLDRQNVPDSRTEEFVEMFRELDIGIKVPKRPSAKRRNVKETRRRHRKRTIDPHAKSKTPQTKLPRPDPSGFYDPCSFGAEIVDVLSSLSLNVSDMDPDYAVWINYLENLVILGYNLYRGETLSDVLVSFVIYMKLHCKGALTMSIAALIADYKETFPSTSDTAEIYPHAMLDKAKSVQDAWEILKTNTVFSRISYLITAAMSFSVCSIREISWSPWGVKLISLEAQKEQVQATDFIDALIKTFLWFGTTGYQCLQERSLYPILYGDQRMRKFNDECDEILAKADQAVAGNVDDINAFERRLVEVLKTVCELKQLKPTGPTALWLQTRYSKLVAIQFQLRAKHANTQLRFAPIGFSLTGPTGVGKSTLASMTMRTSLNAMGYPSDSKGIITKDMFDKYDSIYTSDILGVFFDDVGNGKPDFAVTSPTDVIIKFFNNVSAQAVKAELNAKGVVFISFKCGVMTSNLRDCGVGAYSNCPESILRRFYHVRVSVLPKYRQPNSLLLDSDHPDLRDGELTTNVWSIDIEECQTFVNSSGLSSYNFVPITVSTSKGPLLCEKLTLEQYLDVVILLSQKHKRSQTSVLNRAKDFNAMEFCSSCCRPSSICKCTIQPHSLVSDTIQSIVTNAVKNYVRDIFAPYSWMAKLAGWKPVQLVSTRMLQNEMERILSVDVAPNVLVWTPGFIYRNPIYQRIVKRVARVAAERELYSLSKLAHRVSSFSLLTQVGLLGFRKCNGKEKSWMQISLFGLSVTGHVVLDAVRRIYLSRRALAIQDEYLARRDALPTLVSTVRDSTVLKVSCATGAMLFGLKLFKMWNDSRMKTHSLNSDSTPRWFESIITRTKLSFTGNPVNQGATLEQVLSTFEKSNLFWTEFFHDDSPTYTTRCNVFFPRKGVMMLPHHVWFEGADITKRKARTLKVRVLRSSNPGGVFTTVLDESVCVFPEHFDLCVAFVPNCPDLRTQIKWFPETYPLGTSNCQLFVKQPNFQSKTEKVEATFSFKCGHKNQDFVGSHYRTNDAEPGWCMGLLVSDTSQPHVLGFHIGGSNDKRGVSQSVTRQNLEDFISTLKNKPAVLLSAEATELPRQQYGRDVLAGTSIHPHCMAANFTQEHCIEVLGSTTLRTVQKTTVQPSILAPHVETVMGQSNIWGGPQLKPNWAAYNATLQHLVAPPDMFPPDNVERARQDWLKPLLALAKNEHVEPLSFQEAIVGVPGKKFLDALPMSTGMGFPVFGKKSKWFTDEFDDKGTLVNRIPHVSVVTECDRLMRCWESGERGYPVFSSCLKDEPTKLTSTKVRVFQASAVASSIWIRKFFLPIIRFLHQNPLVAECAVGLNPFSPDWEQIYEHALQYDHEKVLAWDYSKYDVHMSSQVTTAAYSSLIDLGRALGYSEHDIFIMEMIVADCVHPLLDWNGAMLMATCMNPSGINITVDINSIVGSIYVRLGFFSSVQNLPTYCNVPFRSCVSAMTYGDDFLGSIIPELQQDFNYLIYKTYLGKFGIVITPPTKTGVETAFLPSTEADFLKRRNQFIPELGLSVGALDEMSIIKSLCSNNKSTSESKTHVAVSCIQGALNEFFYHGRDTYEFRRKQLQEICSRDRADIPLASLDLSFDDRVEMWKIKFQPSE